MRQLDDAYWASLLTYLQFNGEAARKVTQGRGCHDLLTTSAEGKSWEARRKKGVLSSVCVPIERCGGRRGPTQCAWKNQDEVKCKLSYAA